MRASIESAAGTASGYIATQALAIGQQTLTFTLLFGLMLYFLFFFVRNGDGILEGIGRMLPLGDERERRLFAKFDEVSRATMKGTLVAALFVVVWEMLAEEYALPQPSGPPILPRVPIPPPAGMLPSLALHTITETMRDEIA